MKMKAIIGGLLVLIIVALVMAVSTYFSGPTKVSTSVEIGHRYSVMIYPCDATLESVGTDGKTVTKKARMYDVVFTGRNREMMHQLVDPRFVFRNDRIPVGQGGWYQFIVEYPETEGIKYGTDGWRREFQFNGNLQEPSVIPACKPRG